jgi:lysophospholipase L1-like esterase
LIILFGVGMWRSYLAIGDSFTEGLNDVWPDGSYRGFADRVAETLAACTPGFRYANLAVRGRMLSHIVDEQVTVAERLGAELVTVCAGGNDILRPGRNLEALAELYATAVGRLVTTGADVVVLTGFDPRGIPLLGWLHGVIRAFNEMLRGIASEHGCLVVDLWSMDVLRDRRAWSSDRLHPTDEGHRRVALHILEVLGVPVVEDWRKPWPPAVRRGWSHNRREDLRWTREHLAPWLRDVLRGRTQGYGRTAKRPELAPFTPAAAQAPIFDA